MRIFTLVNVEGESYDITSNNTFFHSPTGLGMRFDHTFRQVGDRWVKVDSKIQQSSIGGSIAFVSGDPYLSYFNFVNFIKKEPLTLLYCPNNESVGGPSGDIYERSVLVSSIDKTELDNTYGYLNCSITMTALTPWYKYLAISNGTKGSEDILRWGIKWGINWGPMDEYQKGIISNGNNNSPAKLVVYGPVINPEWIHLVDGNVYETGKVFAEIKDDEYLLVDNTVDPYIIQKRSGINDAVIADLYDVSDRTTKRFINLQKGRNTMIVTGDDNVKPFVRLEAYIYYDTV